MQCAISCHLVAQDSERFLRSIKFQIVPEISGSSITELLSQKNERIWFNSHAVTCARIRGSSAIVNVVHHEHGVHDGVSRGEPGYGFCA